MKDRPTAFRRKIVTALAIYAASGWAVVEALATVIDRLGLPAWLGTLVTALYIAGLPVTVFLVWRTAGEERRLTIQSFMGAMVLLVLGTTAIFWFTRPLPTMPEHLVAILPCDFTGDSHQAYRAEGLAEDVHARLTRVEAVKISSWNSSLFVSNKGYGTTEIAELLGTDRLVRCRMHSDVDRIELSAELIDPANEQMLWKQDYYFVAADLGTVVTEIAGALLEALDAPTQVAERERINDIGTFSPEAYDLLLEARAQMAWRNWDQKGAGVLDEIERLLDRALEIDPNFPRALQLRARASISRVRGLDFTDMEEMRYWIEHARILSQRALELDPGISGARGTLADICDIEREYLGGTCSPEEQSRLAAEECEILGDTAEGWACRFFLSKNNEEDVAALQRWIELEPTNIDANMQYLGFLGSFQGPSVETLAVFDTMRVLAPEDRRPYGLMSNMLRKYGRLDEVLAWRYGLFGDQPPIHWAGRMARAATDYMNLGLYEQARRLGTRAWETQRARTVHFFPELLVALGEPESAEQVIEWELDTIGSESAQPLIWPAYKFAGLLGKYERAEAIYSQALNTKDLSSLCDAENHCVAWHAMRLVQIERAIGHDEKAAAWLATAEDAVNREVPYATWDYGLRTRVMDAVLSIVQGRYDDAISMLREAIYAWEIVPHGSSVFSRPSAPIYWLETDTWLDPLRGRPDFQAILEEYHAYLEPMRERVLETERTGDWEALRQQTYQRARKNAGDSRETS